MVYWKPLSGIQEPVPIRQFNGVYKPDDEGFNLSDGLFTELINFCPDEFPGLRTRPGYTVVGQFGTGAVTGLMSWKNQELHACFSDGSWRRLNSDGSWTALVASGLNSTADWSHCNFKGNLTDINLIAANGVDPVKRYDGITVQNLLNAPPNANYVTTQSNRLYCATANLLNFSALNKPTDWTTNNDAGQIGLNPSLGENISGLNAGNGHVTVFTPSTTHELFGKGPSSYALEPIAADIGATGGKAVTIHDETLPFVSRDGIYNYSGGIRPRKEYSVPVNNFILGMNKSQLSKCVAGSDGRYIYFAIPYGTATQNNMILQFDPIRGNWYTWDNISVTQMVRVGAYLYFGDATGRVLRLGGTTDNGAAITSTAIFKPFTNDSISRKSHWLKMYIVASISAGASLIIYVSGQASGNNWTLANTLTAESDIQYKEIRIPTNSIAAANAVRIKLVAVGVVSIHEVATQKRELPMRR